MPAAETKYFGSLSYAPEAVFDFPQGLPAFEDQRQFVFIETPKHAPLVFLQSLQNARLCFLALPVRVIDPDYRLAISVEDLEALDLNPMRQPTESADVFVLALVSVGADSPATANLMAPIIVNLATRRALQAIRRDSIYSHQQPIHEFLPQHGAEETC